MWNSRRLLREFTHLLCKILYKCWIKQLSLKKQGLFIGLIHFQTTYALLLRISIGFKKVYSVFMELKKSLNMKWSHNSLVTKHSLSLWGTGAEMLQWLVIFTGYIITSSFSWSLYSALDRVNRLHCPTTLENPERCEKSFYRIILYKESFS